MSQEPLKYIDICIEPEWTHFSPAENRWMKMWWENLSSYPGPGCEMQMESRLRIPVGEEEGAAA